MKKTELLSEWCIVGGQEAMGINWNKRGSAWLKEERSSSEAGCPERLCSLHP